jgi:hypothetical protein
MLYKIKAAGLLTMLLFTTLLPAQQNLVLNSGFEQAISGCGGFNSGCSGSTITSWNSPTGGTPDWFDTCNGGPPFTLYVPQNYAGYQYPHSGNAYAGISPDNQNAYREYITGQFSSPLKGGTKYYVTFYVSLADSQWYASGAMGAYLSVTPPCEADSINVLPYTPQIENPLTNILTDKMHWVPISGEYTALGGEQYITIGDFYSDSLSHFTYVGGGGSIWWVPPYKVTYYYVDDVIVSADSNYADSISSVKQLQVESEKWKVFPNPGKGIFTFQSAGISRQSVVEVYNVMGEKIYSNELSTSSQFSIDLRNEPQGIYLYRIVSDIGQPIASGKLIIQ